MKDFKNAPSDTQKKILSAGFICFAKNGYDKTSMSEIAAKASVSKALLFHYFGTKKEFYFYLFNTARNVIIEQIQSGTDDLFESLTIGIKAKLRVFAKHEGLYDFLLSVVKESNSIIIKELKSDSVQQIAASANVLFANVDWNRFRPEYDKNMIFNLIKWVSDGCIREYADVMSGEQIAAEEEKYFEVLKKALYKGEYL